MNGLSNFEFNNFKGKTGQFCVDKTLFVIDHLITTITEGHARLAAVMEVAILSTLCEIILITQLFN